MATIRRALFLLGTITSPSSYWRGATSSAATNAIQTEMGEPILTELGQSIDIET